MFEYKTKLNLRVESLELRKHKQHTGGVLTNICWPAKGHLECTHARGGSVGSGASFVWNIKTVRHIMIMIKKDKAKTMRIRSFTVVTSRLLDWVS